MKTIAAKTPLIGALLSLPLLMTACSKTEAPTGNTVADNAATAPADITTVVEDSDALSAGNAVADASALAGWIGRWTGPEGLFLDIKPAKDGKAGHFALTIKDNLDTQGSYTGVAQDGAIAFERNGKPETIRAGTGPQTGFKYLMDKKDCLIVQEGKEGYCR
ncbi:MAG TPA: hypothetical protein VF509_15865 [Sphingobium sp.]